MTPKQSISVVDEVRKLLLNTDADLMRKSVEKLYNVLMQLEVEEKTNASKHERTPKRATFLNGMRTRSLSTTVGEIELKIPKIRTGTYMPSFIEPRRMTDKALVSVIQEAYIHGVSTRKVDELVEHLGIDVDKSKVSRLCKEIDDVVESFRNRPLRDKQYPYVYLDATFPKVREAGHVCSMALLIAIGVTHDGNREILGFEVATSENADLWGEFLKNLVDRGLSGVKLIISDSHCGLKNAVFEIFTGVPWQRCRVHFMRNILAHVPQKQKQLVAAIVKTIFAHDNIYDAKKQLEAVVSQLSLKFPKVAAIVLNAQDEVLAYMNFPQKHWQQIYSSNVLERLNKELKRRFNVVSVFPNRDAVIRLAGALLIEQHDEWICSDRRYLSLDSMARLYSDNLEIQEALLLN